MTTTPPDRVRSALAALAAMTSERAETAEQITSDVEAVREAARRDHTERVDEVTEEHDNAQRREAERYERELSETADEYSERLRSVTSDSRAQRQAMEQQAVNEYRELERQLKERVWLAETVYEAGEDRPGAEFRKTKAELDGHLRELAELERAGLILLGESHIRPPRPPESAPEGELASVVECRERAGEQLEALRRLRLPRVMAGMRPFVLGLLPPAAAGAAISGANDWALSESVWIGAGVGLGVSFVLLIVLYIGSSRSARRVWSEIALAIFNAKRAHEREIKEADELRIAGETALKEERVREITSAKDEFEPRMEKIKATIGGDVNAARRTAQEMALDIESERDAAIEAVRARNRAEVERIDRERDEAIARAEAARDERNAAAADRAREQREALLTKWRSVTSEAIGTLGDVRREVREVAPGWEDESWSSWRPGVTYPDAVPYASVRVDLRELPGGLEESGEFALDVEPKLELPGSVAFPTAGSLLIEADPGSRDAALDAIRALMLRLLTTFPPGKARFTIIDPVGLGQSFAGFMHLADYEEALVGARIWTEQRHIEQRLADLTEHMEDVIQKYLRNEFETIAAYNEQAGEIAEPYRFLVVADFPAGFSEDAARRLASIVKSGARCGVFTLMVRDTRQSLPGGLRPVDLCAQGTRLLRSREEADGPGAFRIDDEVLSRFPITLETPPDEQRLTSILHRLGEGAVDSTRVRVPFASIAPKNDQEAWSRSSAERLRVALGRSGATKLQPMTLGEGVAQHALIAGKTGSGKSTLLHALVTNTALWYAPDEVEFYLVDFKKGVEFKTYATHQIPHVRVVAIESDREFGLSVLEEVDAELRRRGDLFRRLGVQSIQAYRELEGSEALPRVLLLIDEFQEFFVQDDRVGQDAALLLDRLVRQGRAFGIHLVLGSQTLGGAYSLARATINQMAVRVALQCSEADAYLIMSEDNTAPRLLSRPGEAIYNDAGGLIDGNSPFQVAWLPDAERDKRLAEAAQLAERHPSRVVRHDTVVFEGNELGDLSRNRAVATGDPGAPEVPAAWLGEPIAIKEPTHALLRRESASNLLIVGQQEETALGMLLSAFVGLGAQRAGNGDAAAKLYFIDAARPDSPFAGLSARLADAIAPESCKVLGLDDVGPVIASIDRTVSDRLAGNSTGEAPVFLVIAGLHRVRDLRRSDDDFGFSFGEDDGAEKDASPAPLFKTILREGPPLGVHTIAWCDSLDNLERGLDRESIRQFSRRVALQMSATDSSQVIDSPGASTLGVNRALYSGGESGALEKFRPYGVPDEGWVRALAERLRGSSVQPPA